jgi:hypothetical protein
MKMTTFTSKRTLLALALVGSLAAQSALACKAPATPRSIPDGRRADMQEMQQAKQEVEQYLGLVSAYFGCQNDALKLQEVSEQQKSVTSRFNAELRAFREANRVVSARPVGLTRN